MHAFVRQGAKRPHVAFALEEMNLAMARRGEQGQAPTVALHHTWSLARPASLRPRSKTSRTLTREQTFLGGA